MSRGAPIPRGGAAAATARGVTLEMLRDQPRKDVRRNTAFALILIFAVAISLIGLAALITDTLIKGAPALSPDLITEGPSSISAEGAGMRPAIIGTLMIMAFVILFIVPVGVGAAVFLEEYASKESRLATAGRGQHPKPRRRAVDHLRAARLRLHRTRAADLGFVVLTASMTLALLVLPIVIIAGREAIRAVPPSIREGSLALGATRWQTIRHQVLPAAIPGIATGVILAVSRAIGETAPLIPLGAATFVTFDPSRAR